MEKESQTQCEQPTIEQLIEMEDLAEKKARIYSRLLTDVSLAKAMETLAEKHKERKSALCTLLSGKKEKKDEA